MDSAEFFSCDWGTTSFRLRRVRRPRLEVVEEIRETGGARTLAAQCPPGNPVARAAAFASFLAARLRRSLEAVPFSGPVHVVVSGMASSSIGWLELPYANAPFPLDASNLRSASFELDSDPPLPGVAVHLLSGVATADDILRGEETELIGLFAGGDLQWGPGPGLVILPGTHSKQVRIESGVVRSWRTFMTGELFDLLASTSVLRASVRPNPDSQSLAEQPEAQQAFEEGVRRAAIDGWARSLFQTRTRTVLAGVDPALNSWFLSGVLIGGELAEGLRDDPSSPIVIAATGPVSEAYALAVRTLDRASELRVIPPDRVARSSVRGHALVLDRILAQAAPAGVDS